MKEGRITVRGIELAYFERGPRIGPTVLMLHATGFHARCWDGVIRELGEGVHVIAVDQRGHGRSTKAPPYDWREFGADAAALVEALDLDGIIGVGHSMGGHAAVQAAGAHPDRFRGLLLGIPQRTRRLSPGTDALHADAGARSRGPPRARASRYRERRMPATAGLAPRTKVPMAKRFAERPRPRRGREFVTSRSPIRVSRAASWVGTVMSASSTSRSNCRKRAAVPLTSYAQISQGLGW